jgi:hypothetical protein
LLGWLIIGASRGGKPAHLRKFSTLFHPPAPQRKTPADLSAGALLVSYQA